MPSFFGSQTLTLAEIVLESFMLVCMQDYQLLIQVIILSANLTRNAIPTINSRNPAIPINPPIGESSIHSQNLFIGKRLQPPVPFRLKSCLAAPFGIRLEQLVPFQIFDGEEIPYRSLIFIDYASYRFTYMLQCSHRSQLYRFGYFVPFVFQGTIQFST